MHCALAVDFFLLLATKAATKRINTNHLSAHAQTHSHARKTAFAVSWFEVCVSECSREGMWCYDPQSAVGCFRPLFDGIGISENIENKFRMAKKKKQKNIRAKNHTRNGIAHAVNGLDFIIFARRHCAQITTATTPSKLDIHSALGPERSLNAHVTIWPIHSYD